MTQNAIVKHYEHSIAIPEEGAGQGLSPQQNCGREDWRGKKDPELCYVTPPAAISLSDTVALTHIFQTFYLVYASDCTRIFEHLVFAS